MRMKIEKRGVSREAITGDKRRETITVENRSEDLINLPGTRTFCLNAFSRFTGSSLSSSCVC
jgi:hypothetical protein